MKSEDTEKSPTEALSGHGARRPELLLAASAVVLTCGLVLAGTVSRTGGGVIVVASWGLFVYGLHRYGRSGRA